jgi:6-pyruvoyl tetrahydropterin synthase
LREGCKARDRTHPVPRATSARSRLEDHSGDWIASTVSLESKIALASTGTVGFLTKMPYRVCKTIDIEIGYMLSKHPGKCKFPHGHTHKVEFVLECEHLDRNGNGVRLFGREGTHRRLS